MWQWLFGKKKTPYDMLMEQGENLLKQSSAIYQAAAFQAEHGYTSSAESIRADARKLRQEALKILEEAETLRFKYGSKDEDEKSYKDTGKIYR